MDTPIGRLGVVVKQGRVCEVRFGGHSLDDDTASRQLREYFAGERRQFDLPLDLSGVTPFRAEVLRALMQVPYGETTTYAGLARAVDNPKAVRAVGSACATNPLPILIPCHRVLRADGQLGGYRGGEAAKRFLLRLEGIDV
ncbi:methylated-DNA--[protein]-cysteine S-methyltransferase [Corynebacterium lujinxingii]|uniref:Methylated-DNA--protein-cysteine methyltransferase n=1 Tax=Corynebacterium lujinxingii TaxID=2763010 RepID=A0A7H0JXW4_9CORY|nr:methylated-DNA--[protein]-cysteine S-methyltransferase [Corynebacterium lujinxingii]MBC3179832.1 methylated-DNA--[protein]-cysteine S-methyltransferase [Corynebacterium lujinxingii]NNO11693.1 methylated-DNA--[protein]-cysteine S-methyltransferase [Corynebacterium lujinxingii]QNP89880.1 methylated-DNA--[protein]-cysteine S-methyltransferase [Corynebacterium lujinxingii]